MSSLFVRRILLTFRIVFHLLCFVLFWISCTTGRASMVGGGIDFDLDGAKRLKVTKEICNSFPIELEWIALSIFSHLQVRDVLSLGSCSKYLNELFNSDDVWKELYKRRWRHLPKYSVDFKGWKTAYIKKHKHREAFVSNRLATVTESETLLQFHYLLAIDAMKRLKLGFEDIYLYFFKKNINVLFNLLGLHYSFFHLDLPLKDLRKVLASCQVSDKEICVSWWQLCSTQDYASRIPAEERYLPTYHTTFLGQIADKDKALLYLLETKKSFILDCVKVSSNVPSNK